MSVPRRPTPDTEGGVSDAELAEIARHLRAVLPAAPADPPRGAAQRIVPPRAERGADAPPVVRYVASFVMPGLALLAVALVLRTLG